MKHKLTLNGVDAPILRQFGCACARCALETRQANVSASLLSFGEDSQLAHHVLFDVGSGVVDSLLDSPDLQGVHGRLDQLFLTHWHRDHVADLNRLSVAWDRHIRKRSGPMQGLPLWCRTGTAAWIRHYYDFEVAKFLTLTSSDENNPPGTVLPAVSVAGIPDVTITPLTLSHYTADFALDREQVVYCCCGYVLESGGTKIVLMWDVDNQNGWLTNPTTAAHRDAIEKLLNADHLFIDCPFWHPFSKPVSHISFCEVVDIVTVLQPKETLLMHISGHPDEWRQDKQDLGSYGWTNLEWTAQASAAWVEHGLTGTVRVPSIGEAFWF